VKSVVPVVIASVCLTAALVTASQELSRTVIPSVDELDEALCLGDITFSQWVRLREIAQWGIDSASLFLSDEIPNLDIAGSDSGGVRALLTVEQERAFVRPESSDGVRGTVSHRYARDLDAGGAFSYQTNVTARIGPAVRADLSVNRTRSGRERFVRRGVSYRSTHGVIRSVTVGTFTTRMGLGTTFGYRGKLLSCSSRLDGESLAYPDHGGYNGLRVTVRLHGLDVESIAGANRDDRHRIVSSGLMFGRTNGHWRPVGIVGINNVQNRHSDSSLTQVLFALGNEYRHDQGVAAAELCYQRNADSSAWGGVVEGRCRRRQAEIRYAVWAYDDNFRDITAGSKAGVLSRSDSLETIDLTYTSKRRGQEGLMLRTTVGLDDNTRFMNEVVVAQYNQHYGNTEFSSGLVRDLRADCSLALEYLGKWKRRQSGGTDGDGDRQEIRLTGRFAGDRTSLRSYIALDRRDTLDVQVSLFTRLEYRSGRNSSLEGWLRCDLNRDTRVGYWYGYVRSQQRIFDGMTLAVKMAHVFRRDGSTRHHTMFALELGASL